jgi:hypothetical protein
VRDVLKLALRIARELAQAGEQLDRDGHVRTMAARSPSARANACREVVCMSGTSQLRVA